MNIVKLGKYLYSYISRQSLSLLLIFSIFINPQISTATIKNDEEIVSVKYLSGMTEGSSNILGAIHFELNPGWKTYWKNPGPFGVRPYFDWSKSKNIENIEFFWPTPKVFDQYDIKVIGYENVVTIPIKITKRLPSVSTHLHIDLEFGVCSDICLIKRAEINSPLTSQIDKKGAVLITKALEKVPSNTIDHPFSVSSCSIEEKDGHLSLVYSILLSKKPNLKPTMLLEYTFSDKYFERQNIEINDQKLIVSASLNNILNEEGVIERERIMAILILDNQGFEIAGCG
mgnify:CR=1 FL=1